MLDTCWTLGSRVTDTRGQTLLETFGELDIELATFRCRGLGSIVDFTYRASLVRGVVWRVTEHYNHSRHQAIFLDITNEGSDSRIIAQQKIKNQDSWQVH